MPQFSPQLRQFNESISSEESPLWVLPDEKADVGQTLGHGVFTWALLKGLTGDAASGDEGGVIYLDELCTYVRDTVCRETNGEQTPVARGQAYRQIILGNAAKKSDADSEIPLGQMVLP